MWKEERENVINLTGFWSLLQEPDVSNILKWITNTFVSTLFEVVLHISGVSQSFKFTGKDTTHLWMVSRFFLSLTPITVSSFSLPPLSKRVSSPTRDKVRVEQRNLSLSVVRMVRNMRYVDEGDDLYSSTEEEGFQTGENRLRTFAKKFKTVQETRKYLLDYL